MTGKFIKGTIPWNKGKSEVYSNDTIKKMRESHIGQRLGVRRVPLGFIPWNKGKTGVYSLNSRKKMSDSQKGRKLSEEHKRKIGLAGKERKISEEHKRKISLANTGKKHPHSDETRRKMSMAHQGTNGSNWVGFTEPIRKQIENSLQYKQWRQKIFIRDDFICKECGQRGGELNAHHKDKTFVQLLEEVKLNLPLLPLYEGVMIYSPFWDVENGVTVHEKCHKNLHKKH